MRKYLLIIGMSLGLLSSGLMAQDTKTSSVPACGTCTSSCATACCPTVCAFKPCAFLSESCCWPCNLKIHGGLGVTNEYVFRGKKWSQSALQPTLSADMSCGCGTAYAKFWANLPVNCGNEFGFAQPASTPAVAGNSTLTGGTQNSEYQFTVGYRTPLCMPCDLGCLDICGCGLSKANFTLDLGYTYYYYPCQATYYNFSATSTQSTSPLATTAGEGTFGLGRANEFYIGLMADLCLNPSVYFYYDVNRSQYVVQGNLSHRFSLGQCLCCRGFDSFYLDLGAYAGWLSAEDYLGDQTRTSYNTFAASTGNPSMGKWNNGYAYAGLTADLVCYLTECARATFGIGWATNNDQQSGDNPFFGYIPQNLGCYENLLYWKLAVDLCY